MVKYYGATAGNSSITKTMVNTASEFTIFLPLVDVVLAGSELTFSKEISFWL